MFGLFKKKEATSPVVKTMEKCHMVINVSVAEYLLFKLKQEPTYHGQEEFRLKLIASSVTNLVFGRGYEVQSGAGVSLDEVMEIAMKELKSNPLMMEAVIQSRRVMAILHFAKTGKAYSNQDFAFKLLEKFGEFFPIEPNPNSYFDLMETFTANVPVEIKDAVMSIKTNILAKA